MKEDRFRRKEGKKTNERMKRKRGRGEQKEDNNKGDFFIPPVYHTRL